MNERLGPALPSSKQSPPAGSAELNAGMPLRASDELDNRSPERDCKVCGRIRHGHEKRNHMITAITCPVCTTSNAPAPRAGPTMKCIQCGTTLEIGSPPAPQPVPRHASRSRAVVLGILLLAAALGGYYWFHRPAVEQTASQTSSDFASARPIILAPSGAAIQSGNLDGGREDLYLVTPPVSGWLTVEMQPAPGSAVAALLYVYDSAGVPLETTGPAARFRVEPDTSYYLKASSSLAPSAGQSRAGAYTLTLKTEPAPADDFGNSFATAHKVALDGQGRAFLPGRLASEDDIDFIVFEAPRSGKLAIRLEFPPDSTLDAAVHAYDANRLPAGLGFDPHQPHVSVTAGQTYYIKVAPALLPTSGRARTGPYTLHLALENDDSKGLLDVTATRPVTLRPSGTTPVTGEIRDPTHVEVLRFQAVQDGLLVVEVKPAPGSKLAANLAPFDNDRVPLGPDNRPVAEFAATAGNFYYLKVASAPSAVPGRERQGAYLLAFHTEPIARDDFGNDTTRAHEVFVPAGTTTVHGRIEVPGDQDCFRIQPGADGWLTIEVTKPADSLLAHRQEGMPSSLPVKKGGEYYLTISGLAVSNSPTRCTGAYDVTFSLKAELPDVVRHDFKDATPIKLPNRGVKLQSGELKTPRDVHFFKVQGPSSGDLKVTLQPSAGSSLQPHLSVYDAAEKLIKDDATRPKSIVQVPLRDGAAYFIAVAVEPGSLPGAYSLEFRTLPAR